MYNRDKQLAIIKNTNTPLTSITLRIDNNRGGYLLFITANLYHRYVTPQKNKTILNKTATVKVIK